MIFLKSVIILWYFQTVSPLKQIKTPPSLHFKMSDNLYISIPTWHADPQKEVKKVNETDKKSTYSIKYN